MGTYADAADVAARLPGRSITTTSSPSTTEIDAWVVEGEAYLHGALAAAQISTPVTDTNGIAILGGWACDYAEARTRMAHASAGGDGANDDGRDLLQQFRDLLRDILDRPPIYQSMLWSGAAGGGTRRMRGYVLDNDDELSIADGDFNPQFGTDEEW